MRTGVVIQARTGSTRLPNKVLLDLAGKSVLQRVVDRASQIDNVDVVILATTFNPADISLTRIDIPSYRGSESDVLDRVYNVAVLWKLDTVVRITADCPLLDPACSSRVLNSFNKGGYDYTSNCYPTATFPDGLDTEVLTTAALERAWREATTEADREHVTSFVWRPGSTFRKANVLAGHDYSNHRWTLDEPSDYEWIKSVYERINNPDMTSILSAVDCGVIEPRLRTRKNAV